MDDGVAGSTAHIGYTRDSSPRHAQVNKVVEKTDKAWQASPRIGAVPTLPGVPDPGRTLKLEHSPEPGGTPEREDELEPDGALELRDVLGPGGTLEFGDASEVGGTDDFVSAPTTPLPVLEEAIPHHHCAVLSDGEQASREGDENRERMFRVETGALNQEAALGLISLIEPDEAKRIIRALLEDKEACREPAKPPIGLSSRWSRHQHQHITRHLRQAARCLGGGDGFGVGWTRG